MVDTTVLADWLINGPELRDRVIKLQQLDPEWLCLDLATYEFGNVANTLRRAGRISDSAIELAWQSIELSDIQFVRDRDLWEISKLAKSKEISYYDASHVWLAIHHQTVLYSRDRKLQNKCPETVCEMPK